jgi:TldD protein
MIDPLKAAEIAISRAVKAGATYIDYRSELIESESLSYADGIPDEVSHSIDNGFGVRLLFKGAWGFCSSADINESEIIRVTDRAIEIARASALLQTTPVNLAPTPKIVDTYISDYRINPFDISLKEKLDFLAYLDELMAKNEGINSRNGYLDFRRIDKQFFNSEGSAIQQTIFQSGSGISLTAMRSHRNRITRSFPANEGQFETRGYELLDSIDFAGNIPRLGEEVAILLDADDCPEKTCDIVLDSSHMSLLIHESIGHPLELDRVFGVERNFSGASFATPDKLDKLQYGSSIINVIADATAPFGLGTFGYDDDGTPAKQSYLIKDGILVNYLSSRETAARIGKESTGASRADGWGNIPIVRMTNTNLLPGKSSINELINGIEDGIYMETTSSWSIDDMRENFRFGCELGREIKNGKLGKLLKNPSYGGNTVAFWNSCDGLGNQQSWRLWGTPNCGKGQPAQNGRVGQGTPPARFRRVKVGG